LNADDPIRYELRRYFVSVADETASREQLAALVQATRDIRSRPAWLAGGLTLGWRLELPAQVVRYAIGASVVALLLIAGFSLGVAERPSGQTTRFEGTWTAIDLDRSEMLLEIGGTRTPAVRYEDMYASGCFDHGDDNIHWISRGRGVVTGNTLTVHFTSAGCTTWTVLPYDQTFAFDELESTLTDNDGTVWRRP